MRHDMNLNEIKALIKDQVLWARTYARIAWKGQIINLGNPEFPVDVDFYHRRMGECMGRARWWRRQIKELYGI